jgi:hypothetical protein
LASRETEIVYGAHACIRVGACTRSQRGRRDCLCPFSAAPGATLAAEVTPLHRYQLGIVADLATPFGRERPAHAAETRKAIIDVVGAQDHRPSSERHPELLDLASACAEPVAGLRLSQGGCGRDLGKFRAWAAPGFGAIDWRQSPETQGQRDPARAVNQGRRDWECLQLRRHSLLFLDPAPS